MLSLVQASEMQLATRKDRFTSRGKTTLAFSLAAGIINTVLAPSVLGSRMVAASLIFSRYRFVKLLFRVFIPVGGTSNLIVGLLDDSANSISDLPTTFNDVAQLRCSTIVYGGVTVPTEFEWKPIDPLRWYYVDAESSGGADTRFVNPCTLCQFIAGATSVLYEIHYTIEFEGASDNS